VASKLDLERVHIAFLKSSSETQGQQQATSAHLQRDSAEAVAGMHKQAALLKQV
jgi:hypothetical protein